MKLLLVSSEIFPFSKTGGLADVAGALPKALQKSGVEVKLISPKYRCVTEKDFSLKLVTRDLKVPVKDMIESSALWKTDYNGVETYFVEKDAYYDREGLYGTKEKDYEDNAERFAFFCRAVIESCKQIGYKPDIIHCNDWQSGLIPAYLKTLYKDDPFFHHTKTIFTIHNIGYQGLFDPISLPMTGLPQSVYNMEELEFYGKISYLKAGIVFSDIINTVSKTYAEEIQTKDYGAGLDGILRKRGKDLYGIMNGIDYEKWNPKKDPLIYANYTHRKISARKTNKKNLQKEMKLTYRDYPLIGIISRLAKQKGIDIVIPAMQTLLKKYRVEFIILGKGDKQYEDALQSISKNYKNKVSVNIGFDEALAHKIYASCDFFLVPSLYEPCGLGPLIAYRYGAIPIVRATGGLKDSVKNYNLKKKEGTGFSFRAYTKDALCNTMEKALYLYSNDEKTLNKMVKQDMKMDWSWEEQAKKYIRLYKKVIKR
ncbi:MAG: glycogen synthase GlgA [Deltaproteobacteria bacterium]|nr:glycogen synthase GlgA [Deltaproteobacteria bacterium]